MYLQHTHTFPPPLSLSMLVPLMKQPCWRPCLHLRSPTSLALSLVSLTLSTSCLPRALAPCQHRTTCTRQSGQLLGQYLMEARSSWLEVLLVTLYTQLRLEPRTFRLLVRHSYHCATGSLVAEECRMDVNILRIEITPRQWLGSSSN